MADTSFNSKQLYFIPDSPLDIPDNISGELISDSVVDLTGTYEYKVAASNGGESLPSTGVFEVVGQGSGVNVYFDLVSGATDYKLFRSISGNNNFFFVAEGTGSPITDLNEHSGDAPVDFNTSQSKTRGVPTIPNKFFESTGQKTLVKEVLVSNGDPSVLFFDLFFVPSGESPNYGNKIFKNISLEESETKMFSLNTVLGPGDSIYSSASAIGGKQGFATVSLRISGIEIE